MIFVASYKRNMKNKIVLILMQLKGISRKTILNYFVLSQNMDCDAEAVQELLYRTQLENKRIKNYSMEEICTAISNADKIIEDSLKQDIHIVTYLDDDFPVKLKTISDPPVILYYKGKISILNERPSVAIIGTREPTAYGIKIGQNLGASFGKRKYVVVSGLAIGCDTAGHVGCLSVDGITVAVMAGGLDKIYPSQNKELAQKIIDKGGCLISEYPVNSTTFKNFFVERDRLQSGLSDAVIVVETGIKGGTLHTVNYTIEYKRLLACYDHPKQYLDEPKTFGNQMLIKEKNALAIGNNDDLEKLREMIENMDNNACKEIKGVQGNIFDFIGRS